MHHFNYNHERNFVVKCEGDSLLWNQCITKLKEKNVGDMVYYIPTVWKSGGTRPPFPHLIAPMVATELESYAASDNPVLTFF